MFTEFNCHKIPPLHLHRCRCSSSSSSSRSRSILSLSSVLRTKQLAGNLLSNDRVLMCLCKVLQPLLLLRCKVVFVALGKHKKSLVPERGKLSLVVHEVHEVSVDCVNHLVRERKLFVQQNKDEVLRSTIVRHLTQLVNCHTRVDGRNRNTFHH